MPVATSRSGSVLGSVVALAVVALLVAGGVLYLVQRERAAEARVAAVAAAEIAQEKVARRQQPRREEQGVASSVTPAGDDVAALHAEVASLKAQLAEAQADADAARTAAARAAGQAERYQKGLERAVDELNRQSGGRAAAARPPSHAPSTDVKAYYGPFVQILPDETVRVWGNIKNYHWSLPADVTLFVELHRNETLIDTRMQTYNLGPSEGVEYSFDFGWRGASGTLSARARVE